MTVPTARSVAAAVLVRVFRDRAFAAAVLDREVSRALQLPLRDRSLATELVYGSLRTLPWLEGRIAKHAPRGLGSLDEHVRAELVLSAYQLFFLSRIPAFAAVNEAVSAVKSARGDKLGAFANAVLRKVAADAERDRSDDLLTTAVWASLPPWLSASLERSLGQDGARAFSAAGVSAPPLGLRVHRPAERDALLRELRAAVPRAEFEVGKASPAAILAWHGGKSDDWPGTGREWTVQEEGSQVVALSVGAQLGETVLDACAGRGNKAALLLSSVGPEGSVDVADLYPDKLAQLAASLHGGGHAPRATYAVDWTVGTGDVVGPYDRILVDAPCSGTGTIRRRPDVSLRRDPEDLARLSALQTSIALSAARCLRPGGRLVYAVCSVLREEAEDVVAAVLARDPKIRLAPWDSDVLQALSPGEPTLRLLPHVHGTDGYYLASFERALPTAQKA
jgi:16S rRNA (cytosine967-C5)-methyltransferase